MKNSIRLPAPVDPDAPSLLKSKMSTLLDPKILMSIKNLPLAAKTTIDYFRQGMHASRAKGQGMEFSQYRSYQPGDDLRQLDWKMYARSDRYYVREADVDAGISVRFLVDGSASMNHQDGPINKIEYARYLTASLAYLAQQQGDAIGLYVFQDDQFFVMAARQHYQHLSRFFYQLEAIRPQGTFRQPSHYQEIYAGTRRRELLVMVTDLYESNQEITALLDALTALGHEIIVFHLVGHNELTLDYQGYSAVQDWETGETIPLEGASAKKAYQHQLEAYLERTRRKMLDRRIFYRLLPTDQPLDVALRDFLNQRNKLSV